MTIRRLGLFFRRIPLGLLLLSAIGVAAAPSAWGDSAHDRPSDSASTIHVSPRGHGSGAGVNDPAPLISALARARPGDFIVLSAGEYTVTDTIQLDVRSITLSGSGRVLMRIKNRETCVGLRVTAPDIRVRNLHLDASNLSQSTECEHYAVLLATAGADFLQVSGIRITGSNPPAAPGAVDFPASNAAVGILVANARAPRLLDLKLSNLPNTAIQISGASDGVLIEEVEIKNSGHRAVHVVDSDGTVRIASNHIDGAVNEGILLQQVTGSVLIEGNTVENIRYLPSAKGGSGIEGGIVHTNLEGAVTTIIRRNTVDIDTGWDMRPPTGQELLDIDGIEINLFGSARGFALIEENHVRNTEDDGIDIDTLDTAELDFVIRNNVISGVHDRGLSLVSGGRSLLRGLVEGNVVSGPPEPRVHPDLSGDGIAVRARVHSQLHITVRDNRVHNAGRKGIDLNMNRGAGGRGPANHARAFFRFEGNFVDGAGQRGIDIQLEDRAFARGLLIENSVTSATDDGIRLRSGAGGNEDFTRTSRLEVTLVKNKVADSAMSGDAGIFTRAQRNSRICVRMLENHSSNPAADNDYMIRSQQDATVELAGLSCAAKAGRPSAKLRAVLVAEGNTGRNEEFPAGVRNNAVLRKRLCDFPADDYSPDLPAEPELLENAKFDHRIR